MGERSFESHQVAVRLGSTELTVTPGDSVTLPLFVHNHGASDGVFEVTVRGIAGTWASVPTDRKSVV